MRHRGAPHYLFDHLQARTRAASGEALYSDITDLLKNTKLEVPGQGCRPLMQDVVVGRVSSVEQGFGFFATEVDDADISIRTDFDDARALWKTIHLRVDVVDRLDPKDSTSAATVEVGLAVGSEASFAELKDGLMGSGSFVFFLARSPVFDYDPPRLSIARDGALLTAIDNGKLSVPALHQDEEERLLGSIDTVAELRTVAKEPVENKCSI